MLTFGVTPGLPSGHMQKQLSFTHTARLPSLRYTFCILLSAGNPPFNADRRPAQATGTKHVEDPRRRQQNPWCPAPERRQQQLFSKTRRCRGHSDSGASSVAQRHAFQLSQIGGQESCGESAQAGSERTRRRQRPLGGAAWIPERAGTHSRPQVSITPIAQA